jgi:hypothetical protein
MTAQDYRAPESVGRLQQRALIVGVIGLVLCAIGGFRSPDQFFRSYLIAFMLVLGVTLGSLGLVMLQHLTGGHWGIVIRRPLESATRTLPLVAVFFIPIVLGMKRLYVWTGTVEPSLTGFQKTYLTAHGFITRAIVYFAIWLVLMFLLNRWSTQQDANPQDAALRQRFKILGGPGIILYAFTMSFAAIDWVMSLSPHWASTIYGFLFIAGQAISSMALMIAVVAMLSRTEPMAGVIQKRHLHDLGKLLFAFIMLWAYFDFSQLLIIWSGNQPGEITFYRSRLHGGWGAIAVVVLLFHFVLPFLLLLSQDVKRSSKWLPKVAVWLLIMRFVDLYWMTRPEFTSSPLPNLLDIAAPLALGGLWLAYFAGQLKQQPLLPLGDPKLAEAIANHEH